MVDIHASQCVYVCVRVCVCVMCLCTCVWCRDLRIGLIPRLPRRIDLHGPPFSNR